MNHKTYCRSPGLVTLFALLAIFSTNALSQPKGLLFVLDGSSAHSPAQFIEQKTAFANVFAKVPVDSSVDIVVTTAGPYDVGIDPNIAVDAAVSAGVTAIFCYHSSKADCSFGRNGYAIGGDTVFSVIPANVVRMFPLHGKWDSRKSVPVVSVTSDDGWSKQTMRLDDGKDYWYYQGEVSRDSGKRVECNRVDCPICNYGYCAHGIGTMGHDGSWGYTGSFVDGVMHGNGEYWSDFATYVGGFKHGKFHGYGVLDCVDVGTFEGVFTNGQFQGVAEDLNRMC